MNRKIKIAILTPKYQHITPITFSQLANYLLWYLSITDTSAFEILLTSFVDNNPIFVASDALPFDSTGDKPEADRLMLPKPNFRVGKFKNESELETYLAEYRKPLKRLRWIRAKDLSIWEKPEITLSDLKRLITETEPFQRSHLAYQTTHNTIDRLTNTAQPFQYTHQPPHKKWIIFKILDYKTWGKLKLEIKISTVFEQLGFGKRSSVGYGFFTVEWFELEHIPGLQLTAEKFSIKTSDVFMSLTDFTPASDPCFKKPEELEELDVLSYRLKVKHPRFSKSSGQNGIYFKPPVIKLEKGSIFTAKQELEFIGQCIKRDEQPDGTVNPWVEVGFGLPLVLKINNH